MRTDISRSTNPAWERALGWPAGEIRQRSLFDLIHSDDAEKVRAGLRDVTDGEPVLHFESRFRRTDGDHRWLSWVAVSQAGKFYCSARDVTQEREAAHRTCGGPRCLAAVAKDGSGRAFDRRHRPRLQQPVDRHIGESRIASATA